MNKEPVAWILNGILHEFDPSDWAKEQYPDQDVIPLYTHPANPKYDPETGEPLIDGYPLFSGLPPAKTLTDEEILSVLNKIADNNEYVYSLYKDFSEIEFSKLGIFEFARAILKKAQEK
jgi:hypothetical protein